MEGRSDVPWGDFNHIPSITRTPDPVCIHYWSLSSLTYPKPSLDISPIFVAVARVCLVSTLFLVVYVPMNVNSCIVVYFHFMRVYDKPCPLLGFLQPLSLFAYWIHGVYTPYMNHVTSSL